VRSRIIMGVSGAALLLPGSSESGRWSKMVAIG
jgi:hypothetical protein